MGGNGQGAGFFVGGVSLSLTANYIVGQPGRVLFRCEPFFSASSSLTFSKNAIAPVGAPLIEGCPNVPGDVGS